MAPDAPTPRRHARQGQTNPTPGTHGRTADERRTGVGAALAALPPVTAVVAVLVPTVLAVAVTLLVGSALPLVVRETQ